mgnify:CR=1 FL=1
MSPEQAAGDDIDGRSDLFALGVLLYEALTGQRPFEGDNLFRLMGEHRAEILRPRARRPDLPESVDALVMQALMVEPEHRFSSANAMKAAVESVIEGLSKDQFVPLESSGPVRAVADAGTTVADAAVVDSGRGSPATTAATVRPGLSRPAPESTGSMLAASKSRWPMWMAVAALLMAGALIAVFVAGDREQIQALPSDGAPAAAEPSGSDVLQREPRPLEVDEFIGRALAMARERLPGAGVHRFEAADVQTSGLVVGRFEVWLVAARPGERKLCGVRVLADGAKLSIHDDPAAECAPPKKTPPCSLQRLHQIFAAAGGEVESLDISFDGSGYVLATADGSMKLDASLCIGLE